MDSLVWNLTIHSDWFFLYMYNNSGYDWSPIDVNVGKDANYYFRENILIPSGQDQWFSTGYYQKFADTRVDAYYRDYPSSAPITWSTVEFTPYWPDEYSNSSFMAALSYPATAKINTNDILSKALPIGGTGEVMNVASKLSKMSRTHGVAVPNTGAR